MTCRAYHCFDGFSGANSCLRNSVSFFSGMGPVTRPCGHFLARCLPQTSEPFSGLLGHCTRPRPPAQSNAWHLSGSTYAG